MIITKDDLKHNEINKILDYRESLGEKVAYINTKDAIKYHPQKAQFIQLFQNDSLFNATNENLKDIDFRVLFFLLGSSEYENKLSKITQEKIAEALHKPQSSISRSLKRLEVAGCLRAEKMGNRKQYTIDEKLAWRGKTRNYPIKNRLKKR